MTMPGRTYTNASLEYRYGFNGQEKESEISGSNAHTSAEYWMYDSRLGRRWNMDPVVNAHESPFAAFANSPIWLIDPYGADTTVYIFHKKLQNGTYSEDDNIKSDKQMREIRDEMQKIFDLNEIGVNVVVIKPEQVKELKLDYTDAIISFQNWTNQFFDEGNTGIYNDGSIDLSSTYISTYASKLDAELIKKNGGEMSYNEIIAYKAAHEITHQYLEKARYYIFGSKYKRHNGGHYNKEPNILMDGSEWRVKIANNPTKENIEA